MEAMASAAGPSAYANFQLLCARKRKREEDERMRERVAADFPEETYFGMNREANARVEHLQQRIFGGAAAVAQPLSAAPAGQTSSAAPAAHTSSAAPAGQTSSAAPAAQTSSAAAAGQTSSAAPAAQTSSAAAAVQEIPDERPPGWMCTCASASQRGRRRHLAACAVMVLEKQHVQVGAEVCMLASALPTWGKWRAAVVQPSKVVWLPVNGEGGDPKKSEVTAERRVPK